MVTSPLKTIFQAEPDDRQASNSHNHTMVTIIIMIMIMIIIPPPPPPLPPLLPSPPPWPPRGWRTCPVCAVRRPRASTGGRPGPPAWTPAIPCVRTDPRRHRLPPPPSIAWTTPPGTARSTATMTAAGWTAVCRATQGAAVPFSPGICAIPKRAVLSPARPGVATTS